jgi:hypothetical protein
MSNQAVGRDDCIHRAASCRRSRDTYLDGYCTWRFADDGLLWTHYHYPNRDNNCRVLAMAPRPAAVPLHQSLLVLRLAAEGFVD